MTFGGPRATRRRAASAIGVALVALSLAGSLYIVTGLARAAAAGLVALTGFAAFWTLQGQFRGW